MNIGNALKSERESIGISQTELARRVKTNQSYISAIEAGNKDPTLYFICKLCIVFGLSVSSFVEIAEQMD